MKMALGIMAIVLACIGALTGVTDWYLTNYVLEDAGWSGPLYTLQQVCWLLTPISFGGAIALTAAAAISGGPSTPPPPPGSQGPER